MNILLTGASGFIGTHLLGRLQREGHRIVACVRQPERFTQRHPHVTAIACDFANDISVSTWAARLTGIDIVINAVGIIRESRNATFDALHRDAPIALFQAAAHCGVKKVVQISALGADAHAESHYHLSKRAADDALSNLDVPWTILRPSIVYGPGAKSTALFRALAALPITPVIGDGHQPVQPIHIDDLVEIVVQSLAPTRHDKRRLDLVGPAPVTLRAYLDAQRRWLDGGTLRTLSISYAAALPLARAIGFFATAPLTAQTVAMLERGNTAPVEPMIQACGFEPRSIDAVLARSPATDADVWHAQLYFLKPLLRLSIAALWIFTGIVSAFFYPTTDSYTLLAQVGITGALAPVFLYGAAAVDALLGLALLTQRRIAIVAMMQICVIVIYTAIISVALPEFWLYPYGPVVKNIPLLVATLMMMAMEKR